MTDDARTGDGARILLVEDNPRDARLIREMLRDVEWPATVAADGTPELVHVERLEEALETRGEATALVLLDLELPDSEGLETVERFVSAAGDEAVVVLTGLHDEETGRRAIERGAQDFLVKDEADPRTLRRTIHYAVERERQQREIRRRADQLSVLTWLLRHEVRDEMTVVVGRGRALRDHVDAAGEAYLEEVIDAGEEVIELTDAVREFTELVTGESAPERRRVPLRETVDDEVDRARRTYDAATVRVDGTIPDVEVVGSELLGSVFRNLISNAVRHADDGVTVTVSGGTEGEEAVVVVADDGPGIPDSRKEAIFDRDERRQGSPGTGVGLFLVQTLVEEAGGRVTVEDNDPTGSRFVVRLPVAGG